MSITLEKDQTLLCDGDSLTNFRGGAGYSNWPYMRLNNWDRNWGDIVAENIFAWFPHLNITMRNVAVGGSTSVDVLNRFDEFVAPHKPDYVFMTIGANDANKGLSEDETREALSEYCKKLNDVSGGQLCILGNFQVCPNAIESRIEREGRLQARAAVVKEIVEKNNGVYLNIGDGMKQNADALAEQYAGHNVYCEGDSHFSHLGNMVIAGELMRALGLLH